MIHQRGSRRWIEKCEESENVAIKQLRLAGETSVVSDPSELYFLRLSSLLFLIHVDQPRPTGLFMYSPSRVLKIGTGEMDQCLQLLAFLLEDLGSALSTHMELTTAQNYISREIKNYLLTLAGTRHSVSTLTYMQANTYLHKIKTNSQKTKNPRTI